MRSDNIIYAILLYASALAGWYITSFGVLIPYYSQVSGHDQTYYSFLFIVKSIAEVSGSILIKYVSHRFSIQATFILCYLFISISLFLCSLSLNSINLIVMLYLSGLFFVSSQVLFFSITLKLFQKERPQFRLVILGLFFGIGATISPLFTMIFQLQTYKVLAGLSVLVILLVLKYPLPNLQQTKIKKKSQNVISSKTEIYICLIMLLLPAQQIGFASWLPTYSIKAGISSTQKAASYSFYFWLSNSISRVIWAFFFTCSVTNKLKIVSISVTIISFFLVGLQYLELYQLVCIIGPITFGFMLACVYAFCLALPLDNGYQSTTSNSANFVLANCLGEGLLSAPIGYSMNIFGFKSLIVIMSMACILSLWSYYKTVESMKQNSHQDIQKGIILQQIK